MVLSNQAKKYFELTAQIKELEALKKELLTDIINELDNPTDKTKVCDGVVYHCQYQATIASHQDELKALIRANGKDVNYFFKPFLKEYIQKQKTE